MKRMFLFLALIYASTIARADLVLRQQIVAANYTGIATVKVKGAKVRLDLYAGQPQAVSTISDLSTGDSVTLMHNQKVFVKTLGGLMKQAKSSGSGAASKAPVPHPTGKTEKVGAYNTDIYTWSNSRGITGTAWVAKNYPDFAKIRADLAVVDQSAAEMNNGADPELSRLPGMVVKTQVTGGSQTIVVTLVSAQEEPVDASLFQTPANYKELPRPKPFVNQTPQKAPGK